MKTQTKKTSKKILDAIKDFKNITESQLDTMLEQVYQNIIVNFKTSYNYKGKTVQEVEEYAESVITVADSNMTTILRAYSLDNTDHPYRISNDKITIMKHYARILISSDKQYPSLNELFYSLFYLAYAPCIQNAIQHKAMILEERKKQSQN